MRYALEVWVVVLVAASANSLFSQPPVIPSERAFRQMTARDGAQNPTDAFRASDTELFHSYDPQFPPPTGATDVFALSQDYPESYNGNEEFPWTQIDFRVNPNGYLRSVLDYCLDGNTADSVDFRGQLNAVRKWYHAPWMHDDGRTDGRTRSGREFHRGLTKERASRPKELHPMQMTQADNWAVSMYNDRGGYQIGKVWLTTDGYPDPSQATFPDNTVSFKLLFTLAKPDEVPFLQGSKTWTANVASSADGKTRSDAELRLLQIDISVKDPRLASTTGWVFGTFIYSGGARGTTIWDRMIPVGLSFGDDPTEKRLIERDGSFVNPYLRETALNAALLEPPAGTEWGTNAYMRHHGLGGRLNGPVDNKISSCISCHGRAATYAQSLPPNSKSGSPMSIVSNNNVKEFDRFFRLIRGGSHLETDRGDTFVTTDYSLQLSVGIKNFYQSLPEDFGLKLFGAVAPDAVGEAPKKRRLPDVSR